MTEKTRVRDDENTTHTRSTVQADASNAEPGAGIAERHVRAVHALVSQRMSLFTEANMGSPAKKIIHRDRVGTIAVDHTMAIVYANDTALQKLDFDRSDISFRKVLRTLPVNVGRRLERACLEALDIGGQASFEVTPSVDETGEVTTEAIDGLAIMKIQNISSTAVVLRGSRAAYDEILTRYQSTIRLESAIDLRFSIMCTNYRPKWQIWKRYFTST